MMTSRSDAKRPRNQNVGEAIKYHRVSRGLTQAEFGKLAGVNQQQIHKYENGANQIPSDRLIRLAKRLGIPADDLLGLNGIDARVSTKPVRKKKAVVKKRRKL